MFEVILAADDARSGGYVVGTILFPFLLMAVFAVIRRRRHPELSFRTAMFSGWPLWTAIVLTVLSIAGRMGKGSN